MDREPTRYELLHRKESAERVLASAEFRWQRERLVAEHARISKRITDGLAHDDYVRECGRLRGLEYALDSPQAEIDEVTNLLDEEPTDE